VKSNFLMPMVVLGVVVGGGALTVFKSSGSAPDASHLVDVSMPTLSAKARLGAETFAANCIQCHGKNAGGSDQGPPLVHEYYEPNHHADGAFYLAGQRGVRAHHWPFGDMPPQPQVSQVKMSAIVQYVREIQKHNGIF